MKPILQIDSTLCSTDLGKLQTTVIYQIVNQNVDNVSKPGPRNLSSGPQEVDDTLGSDPTLGKSVHIVRGRV